MPLLHRTRHLRLLFAARAAASVAAPCATGECRGLWAMRVTGGRSRRRRPSPRMCCAKPGLRDAISARSRPDLGQISARSRPDLGWISAGSRRGGTASASLLSRKSSEVRAVFPRSSLPAGARRGRVGEAGRGGGGGGGWLADEAGGARVDVVLAQSQVHEGRVAEEAVDQGGEALSVHVGLQAGSEKVQGRVREEERLFRVGAWSSSSS